MAELGFVRRYHYWSSRRVQDICRDNDISLSTMWSWVLTTPSIPFVGQIGIGQQQRDLRRNEIADKLESAIGRQAVADLVTPPPVQFAKGSDHIEFARFLSSYAGNEGAVMYARKDNSDGSRADICLFGSMDNFAGYIQKADYNASGWTSSTWYAIDGLLNDRGQKGRSQWDEESQAVEALKIALGHGGRRRAKYDKDQPSTRAFTIGNVDDAEWFAEIYADVELTADRWNFHLDDELYGAERILIGAPLWIRTASPEPISLYHTKNNGRRRGSG